MVANVGVDGITDVREREMGLKTKREKEREREREMTELKMQVLRWDASAENLVPWLFRGNRS